ncbi:WNT1-inducible-signaling pathway protein 1-like [Pecten maximus]|uniref:WNT1-inducible-signaling pathway protein 1-like n=1 Tax=Pecten maximus TaxID=6579 RepID=UPI001457F6F6|nr:WNT1-inducible-signaling pathway protein 1-like [Pecten maximus]
MTLAPQTPQCVDQITDCEVYGTSVCHTYKTWAFDNCALYCGYCGFVKTPPTLPLTLSKGSCHDALPQCKGYGQDVCSQFTVWARQNCASYCGFCDDEATTKLPLGSNGCYFNNVVHAHGEMWQEGCDYQCECLDGSTGNYTCRDLCLKWNLPLMCHLEDPAPGKCCKTPSCPCHIMIQYPPWYTPV